jgi:TnpA family transposase
MTLTADSKKRVVLPGAAPGDVFTCDKTGPELILRRVHRAAPQKKPTKAAVVKAIRGWKSVPKVRWEELRKMTREI